MRFEIQGRLPTMNEMIASAKRHWSEYARMKKAYTRLVAYSTPRHKQFSSPHINITWVRKNKKADPDNIMAGQKFIFDGLQQAGIIDNDGWNIKSITHTWEVGKEEKIVVELKEE